MVKINIICVGKLKEKYLKDAVSEYTKRIGAFANIHITEISEYRLPSEPSNAQIEKGLCEEGKLISEKLKNSYAIALCIEGKKLSSECFAEKLRDIQLNSVGEISFIIGSSYGLSENVKKLCKFRLSISDMTFPHQLMRVILCEQIYRAFQINSNGKYHK